MTARRTHGHGDPGTHVMAVRWQCSAAGPETLRAVLSVTPWQLQLRALGSAFPPCARSHAAGRERGSGMQLRSETELMCLIFLANLPGCSPSGKHTFSPLLLLAKAGRLQGQAMGWGGRLGPHMQ